MNKIYVTRIFYDDLSDPKTPEKQIERHSWQDAERIINSLDGKNTTQICMDNGSEDNYFCVGGGNGGLCNVFVSENDNETIHTLLNPNPEPVTRKLVTGGQAGDFEDRIVVPLETAMIAAKKYFETGELCEEFEWE